MLKREILEELLKRDLASLEYPHSPLGSGIEGWKVFSFPTLGEAELFWAWPDDRRMAESGEKRSPFDNSIRTKRLTRILEILRERGYIAEMNFAFEGSEMQFPPSITITRVPLTPVD
jgi:hypothetical protein